MTLSLTQLGVIIVVALVLLVVALVVHVRMSRRRAAIDLRGSTPSPEFDAIADVIATNIEIEPGELLFVVGGNGTAMSTLLEVLPTATMSASGDISDDGGGLNPRLSVNENLRFFAKASRLNRAETAAAISAALDQVELIAERDTRVNRLNHEQYQRVSIARALVRGSGRHGSELNRSGILLFDEPYAHHDKAGALRLDMLLMNLRRRGHTIAITSDVSGFDRCFRMADRVVVLQDGRVVHQLETDKTSPAQVELVYRELLQIQEQDDDASTTSRPPGDDLAGRFSRFDTVDFSGPPTL